KLVAHQLSYIYIDTGAMYRALTLKALQNDIPVSEEKALYETLTKTKIELKQDKDGQRVLLDGVDVTDKIRSQSVSNNVSFVSEHPLIRKDMVKKQQALANKRGVVMDGRDIGTHVIPDAEVKIFLVASVSERAKRRNEENIQKGYASDLEKLKAEIEKRDKLDSKRVTAPLLKAEGAYELDTTSLSIEEVVAYILNKVEEVQQGNPKNM